MARAIGIGGVFVKARDPEGLAAWYRQHLGLAPGEGPVVGFRAADAPPDGFAIWSAFEEGTDYFEPSRQRFMVNFTVDDLDGVLAQLREGGAQVDERIEDHAFGRFGWFMDPEGNRVELWEPNGAAPWTASDADE